MPKITQPYSNVYRVRYKKNYQMALALMRIDNFLERDCGYLSLEDVINHSYATYGELNIDKWVAYCFTSEQIHIFLDTFEDDLLVSEEDFFGLLPKRRKSDYYVVVTYENPKEKHDFKHEMAHVFYYCDAEYQETMDAQCFQLKIATTLEKYLSSFGYADIIYNEMQAYLATSRVTELSKLFGERDDWQEVCKGFRKVFNAKFKEFR